MSNYEKMWQEMGLDVALHNEVLQSINQTFTRTVGSQKNRPKGMEYFDHVLHESHGGRIKELLELKSKGKKTVGTFCIYVPEEIVMAAGLVPIALCGGTQFSVPFAEKTFPRDICPLVKSTLGLAFSKTCPYAPLKSMAVGETTCDAKKKTWDILAKKVNFHVMEIPQKKGHLDIDLWRAEVNNFKDRIEELAGRKIDRSSLIEQVRIMNNKREALHALNELRKIDSPPISGLDTLVIMQAALNDEPVRFTDKLNILNDELADHAKKGVSPFSKGIKRILVSGCPAVMGNWKTHWLIENSGAAVVCDETCTGSRYYENPVEETSDGVDAQILAIADRYMKVNCSCFTPNEERIEGIINKVKEFNIHGVVQYILQYCHGYNVEAIRVDGALKKINIPSIKIETDYSEEDAGQLRTRIEAFVEQLS